MASQPKPLPSSKSSSCTFGSLLGSKNHRASSPFRSESPSRPHAAPFDFDSTFSWPAGDDELPSRSVNSPPPAYDKPPVYDDDVFDIFDGVPGLKNSTKVKLDDDVFAVFDSVPKLESSPAEDNFENVFAPVNPDGGALDDKESKDRKRSEKDDRVASEFDDWYIV